MTNENRADKYDANELWRKDRDHFIHPFSDITTFHENGALVITEGEGAYVFDANGKRYLDGIGGLWCVNESRQPSPRGDGAPPRAGARRR